MTPAIQILKKQKIPHKIYTYECSVDHDFGHHCATELKIDEHRVYKTLLIHHEKRYVTAVIPVNCTLNMKKASKVADLKKVEMADPKDAERITGFVVGGISPLGQKKRLPTILDSEALKHEEILVSGGKRGVSVGINPSDLVKILSAQVGNITDVHEE